MMTGALVWDRPTCQLQGSATLTTELLLNEEFKLRGITMETLQYLFPLHFTPPQPARTQWPLTPPVQGAPQLLDNLVSLGSGDIHVVMDIPDTPQIVELSSNYEPMEDLEDHLEAEEDLELWEQQAD